MTANHLLCRCLPLSNPKSATGLSYCQLFFRPPSNLHRPFPCHLRDRFLHFFVPLNAGPRQALAPCLVQEALAIRKLGVLPRCDIHARRWHLCKECRDAPEQGRVRRGEMQEVGEDKGVEAPTIRRSGVTLLDSKQLL